MDYVLMRYDEERASDLTELVNEALPEARDWLGRLEARVEVKAARAAKKARRRP
jgi:hypothetical protein